MRGERNPVPEQVCERISTRCRGSKEISYRLPIAAASRPSSGKLNISMALDFHMGVGNYSSFFGGVPRRGSVPAMRRSIFERCLKITSTAMTTVPKVTVSGGAPWPGA
jgi:hypothetical protein